MNFIFVWNKFTPWATIACPEGPYRFMSSQGRPESEVGIFPDRRTMTVEK